MNCQIWNRFRHLTTGKLWFVEKESIKTILHKTSNLILKTNINICKIKKILTWRVLHCQSGTYILFLPYSCKTSHVDDYTHCANRRCEWNEIERETEREGWIEGRVTFCWIPDENKYLPVLHFATDEPLQPFVVSYKHNGMIALKKLQALFHF